MQNNACSMQNNACFTSLHDIADCDPLSADKDKGDMPQDLIPRPRGAAGRTTITDGGGRTCTGFNLHDKMGLSKPEDHETYNDFQVRGMCFWFIFLPMLQDFIHWLIPGDRYTKFTELGFAVTGNICLKVCTIPLR